MRTIDNFHRVSRLLAVVCVALTISAPLATAYVIGGNSAALTEQTGSQVDRSKKGDPLRISPHREDAIASCLQPVQCGREPCKPCS